MSVGRNTAAFACALAADAPRRVALALLFLLAAGVTETFGLVMLIPLLHVIGLGGPTDEGGAVTEAVERAAVAIGIELTPPTVLGIFVALVAVRAATAWQRDLLLTRVSLEFTDRLRARLYAAIAGASWEHLLRRRQSDLLHVLTADVERISRSAYALLRLTVFAVLAAAQLAAAVLIAPLVTAAALAAGATLIGLSHPLTRRSHMLGQSLTRVDRGVFATVIDFLAGLRVARNYDAEASHVRRFTDELAATRHYRLAFRRTTAGGHAILEVGGGGALAALVWLAVSTGAATLTELAVVALIFARVLPAMSQLQQHVFNLVHNAPAYAHARDMHQALLDAAEHPADDDGGTQIALRRAITLRGVSFAYDSNDGPPALDQIELDLPAGGLTAITGPSGAGKTTLADILSGVLEPTGGEVLVDDVPLSESNRRRWRRSVASVPQEPYLFHDTIRANLLWARPGAADADLWRALRLAAAADFVAALPNGLETVINDRGARLSGGERQRITLARALLREPTLLLLDEATTHLDADNERRVVETLASLRGRTTVVAVAHGDALLAAADTIVRLEAGRLAPARGRRIKTGAGAWPSIAKHATSVIGDERDRYGSMIDS